MKLVALLALSCLSLGAQTYLPSAVIAAGATYTNHGTAPSLAGFASVAVQVGTASRTYSITTIDITPKSSSVRTGVGYLALQSGNLNLLTHIDGGLTSTASSAVGSFSGGLMVMYDLGGVSKALKHTYWIGVVRIVSVTGSGFYPVYEAGFGKAF